MNYFHVSPVSQALCLLLSNREHILCPILALQTNLKHVYCNENKSSSKDEVLLFPQLILCMTKSKHSELFLNPGHFSFWDPELHLPNQQESGILRTGEPSTAHRPSAKELIQQEPGSCLSQQLVATSPHTHTYGEGNISGDHHAHQLSSASSQTFPTSCPPLGSQHGFWNGDALSFTCPCVVLTRGKTISHSPPRTGDQHSDGLACILAAKQAGPSKN